LNWEHEEGLEVHLAESRTLLLQLVEEDSEDVAVLDQLVHEQGGSALVHAVRLECEEHVR